MLIVVCTAGAAALAVIAYTRLRNKSPEVADAGLRAVRELAAIALVFVRAVEAVVDVLSGRQRYQPAPVAAGWRNDGFDVEEDDG